MGRPNVFMPPVKILGADIDDENLVFNAKGEVRHDYHVVIAEEDGVDHDGNPYVGIGAIKSGRYCARCLEPQDQDLPEKCWVCQFPMRERQGEFLAKGYRGHVRVGPSSSREDEDAIMQELNERQQMAMRDEILRPTTILLPGKDF